jgi:prevent-host-death family protein
VEPAPDIVTISDFRRDAAGIIGGAVASGAPVFVTQHGRVTAVVLSRDRYDGLLHRSALVKLKNAEGADPLPAAEAGTRPATALVETMFGFVEPETADFLTLEGFGVEARTRDSAQHEDGESPARS